MSRPAVPRPSESLPKRFEIEAKYAIPDDRTFERLRALESLAGYTFHFQVQQDIDDVYLDTAGRDLLRAGWACRIRRGVVADRQLVTLKGLGRARGAIHRREEHEIETPAGLPLSEWPVGPVRDTVLSLAHGATLETLLELHQVRILHDVRRDGRVAAVRFLDRVVVSSSSRQLTTLEMEIELQSGGNLADLWELERVLRRFRLQAESRSKLERALAWVESTNAPDGAASNSAAPPSTEHAPPEHQRAVPPARRRAAMAPAVHAAKRRRKGPAVRGDEPIAEAGRTILAFHCERMLEHEDGTRAGTDLEELHAMRVATRRQRAALRIVQPHFRRKAIEPVRRGLRDVARGLGAVRDLDVLLEELAAYRGGLHDRGHTPLEPLALAWAERRDRGREALLAYQDGSDWAAFKDEYGRVLATPGAGVRATSRGEIPQPHLVAQVLPAEIWSHYGAIRAYEAVLSWAAPPTLHALRIECKRLRYLLEFFRDALDGAIEESIDNLVALQDHLGKLNDSHVTEGLVREFLAGPRAVTPEIAAASGRYLEFNEDRVRALRRDLGVPWAKVTGPDFRGALATAVAVL